MVGIDLPRLCIPLSSVPRPSNHIYIDDNASHASGGCMPDSPSSHACQVTRVLECALANCKTICVSVEASQGFLIFKHLMICLPFRSPSSSAVRTLRVEAFPPSSASITAGMGFGGLRKQSPAEDPLKNVSKLEKRTKGVFENRRTFDRPTRVKVGATWAHPAASCTSSTSFAGLSPRRFSSVEIFCRSRSHPRKLDCQRIW